MKTRFARFSSLLFLLGSLAGYAAGDSHFTGGRWIDLTQEFSAETLYWPAAEKFTLESEFHGQTPKGYFYAANRYRASEHGGTLHPDAARWLVSKRTIKAIGWERENGPQSVGVSNGFGSCERRV